MLKNVNIKVHEAQFALGVKHRWRVPEQGFLRGIFICMVEKVAGWKKLKNIELMTCT
jgi:hypothetical protein